MVKVVCLPCEIQHREFDSKLLLAARLASCGDCLVLIGYDKYFTSILETVPNCFLLDKSMSTIMFNARIKPCKEKDGLVFVNDEEGVNDLEETPEALDIRADQVAIDAMDKFLAWGEDDASFYSSRKSNISHKIVITGSHRYDLLNDIGRFIYEDDISAIRNIFGDFVLYNDNLAVDHFDKSYSPPTNMFNSSKSQQVRASNEWNQLVSEHTSRRIKVRDNLIYLAQCGFNIVVRPHPVYDSIFWHESFRLIPNITTIYRGPVEPWIHASSAVITTGCTTGIQAILADKPSYEMPIGNSNAFSSSVLPPCLSYKSLLPSSLESNRSLFLESKKKISKRWFHSVSPTLYMSELISDAILQLPSQKSLDWMNSIASMKPTAPKWRSITSSNVLTRLNKISKVLKLNKPLKCVKLANSLYAIQN